MRPAHQVGAASFYIYYRVRPESTQLARGLVERLTHSLARRFGVQGRLLVRRDEPLLWMEVYEAVGDAREFEVALEAECEQLGFVGVLIAGSVRHCECFVEPTQCA